MKSTWNRGQNTPIGFGKPQVHGPYGEMVRNYPHYCAYVAELQDLQADQAHSASKRQSRTGRAKNAPAKNSDAEKRDL